MIALGVAESKKTRSTKTPLVYSLTHFDAIPPYYGHKIIKKLYRVISV